jgi:hypothetical protein
VIGLADVPATGSARERVEELTSRLPATEAFAAVEHLFGVLPLAGAFFARGSGVVPDGELGALGLFTPTPALGWAAAAIDGEPAAGGVLLHGEIRSSSPAASGTLVLARLAGPEHRLAWLDRGAPGVEPRAGRLSLEGVVIGSDLLSRPVPLADLHRHLEAYAALWALAATVCARDGVRALRRAARTTLHRGTAFSTSQLVAMGIAEVEIEAELAAAAVRQHFAAEAPDGAAGLVLATAAARSLSNLAAKTAELRDRLGLAIDGPLADDGETRILTASLGGPLMLESELARALGIPGEPG